MFSKDLEITLRQASTMARSNHHEFLTVEHLLLALLDNESAIQALEACQADLSVLRNELLTYIHEHSPTIDPGLDQVPTPTPSLDRIIQRANFHVQSSSRGSRSVEGSDVLVAMFSERDSFAVYLLKKQDITRLDLTQFLSHRTETPEPEEKAALTAEEAQQNAPADPLKLYTNNLNERANKGKTDPLVGRSSEIDRAAQILCRRRKNNPLFVGDPGVGKTSIAEGLAWLIDQGLAPKPLLGCVIYALDVGALIAGTKYRGDFEKRMKQLLEALKKQPGAVLFIDEIHMIIGAGSSMGSNMDVSNLIKPALADGSLRCMGSTTFQEYRQVFEKDHALSRRFQKIDILEPSISETIEILKGLRPRYEEFHNVTFSDEVLAVSADLASKHIHERFMPDKAIDVLDETGSYVRIRESKAQKDDSELVQVAATVEDVEHTVSKLARIPEKTVSRDDKGVLESLETDLKRVVFGQNEAIERIVSSIKLARAGLKPLAKPVGSFMFAGPTGVGKTELAKQLAHYLGIEFARFDMSEYMEAHTASRLIGAPPGYVGFDQGGLLTDKVTQHPHCVLLLDEIEKAHPDVFNLLLQVMDHGALTDNNGRKAVFNNVILIMTTNVGAEAISRTVIGFTPSDTSSDNSEAMKRVFTPEFRNRLDAIVQFNPLPESIIESVVDKFLVELQAQLDEKKVTLEIDKSVYGYFAKAGYDRLMGARPMQRVIQDELKRPLADMILFGDLQEGGVAQIDLDDSGKLRIQVAQASEPATT